MFSRLMKQKACKELYTLIAVLPCQGKQDYALKAFFRQNRKSDLPPVKEKRRCQAEIFGQTIITVLQKKKNSKQICNY